MTVIADIPDTPTANQEYIFSGKSWSFISNLWKKNRAIISDGGFSTTVYAVTDDGGNANGL